jgi:hypothetical protein
MNNEFHSKAGAITDATQGGDKCHHCGGSTGHDMHDRCQNCGMLANAGCERGGKMSGGKKNHDKGGVRSNRGKDIQQGLE